MERQGTRTRIRQNEASQLQVSAFLLKVSQLVMLFKSSKVTSEYILNKESLDYAIVKVP